MAINIKKDSEVEIMLKGGKILHRILDELVNLASVGKSTEWLDAQAYQLCKGFDVKPGCLGFSGYPKSICVGRNDVVVHGIPSKYDILKEGDIVSIDMTIVYQDFFVDSARTIGIGKIDQDNQKFIDICKKALNKAINEAKEGNTLGDIGNVIESTVTGEGFSVVKQMVGHGIGRSMHEEPKIPGYGQKGVGEVLKNNMTLAIEAIINQGEDGIYTLSDGWTTRTVDGKLSGLFEHTVAIKGDKPLILT